MHKFFFNYLNFLTGYLCVDPAALRAWAMTNLKHTSLRAACASACCVVSLLCCCFIVSVTFWLDWPFKGPFHTCGHVNRLGRLFWALLLSLSFAYRFFAPLSFRPDGGEFNVCRNCASEICWGNNNGLEYSKIYLRYYLEKLEAGEQWAGGEQTLVQALWTHLAKESIEILNMPARRFMNTWWSWVDKSAIETEREGEVKEEWEGRGKPARLDIFSPFTIITQFTRIFRQRKQGKQMKHLYK